MKWLNKKFLIINCLVPLLEAEHLIRSASSHDIRKVLIALLKYADLPSEKKKNTIAFIKDVCPASWLMDNVKISRKKLLRTATYLVNEDYIVGFEATKQGEETGFKPTKKAGAYFTHRREQNKTTITIFFVTLCSSMIVSIISYLLFK